MGKVAMSPLRSRGSPPLQGRGQNQKWPTCRQSGYVTPAVSEIPTALERGGEIRSGPLLGTVATSPLPSPGSPPLQSRGQNQKWPTCGQSGCITSDISGIPTASQRGGNHKRPTSGQSGYITTGKIRSGTQVGKMATSPLPSRGSAGGKV